MKKQFAHVLFVSILLIASTSLPASAQDPVTPKPDTLKTDTTQVADHKTQCKCGPEVDKGESGAPKQKLEQPTEPVERTPSELLTLILLGAIFGMTGQGIRAVIGIKKSNDSDAQAKPDGTTDPNASGQFRATQLVVSLFISLVIGAIAGVLAAVSSMSVGTDTGSLVSTFIAAGYAGTDFIEGFMKRSLPNGEKSTKKNDLGSALAH